MPPKGSSQGPYGATKLDLPMQAKIVEAARSGLPLNRIHKLVNLSHITIQGWLKHGEADHEAGLTNEYTQLYVAVEQAETQFMQEAIILWRAQFKEDWRAIEKFLSRRFPKEWGQISEQMQGAEDGSDPIRIHLKEEEYEAI